MYFDFSKHLIRSASIIFCLIFLSQMVVDVYSKLENSSKKLNILLSENIENDSNDTSLNDDFETENEQEFESENDKIISSNKLFSFKYLSDFYSISQARLIQINLSAGFFKTIQLPPEKI